MKGLISFSGERGKRAIRGLERRIRVAREGRKVSGARDVRVEMELEVRVRDSRLGVQREVVRLVRLLEEAERARRAGKQFVRPTIFWRGGLVRDVSWRWCGGCEIWGSAHLGPCKEGVVEI